MQLLVQKKNRGDGMIKIVKGDLMQATENIIGHQVNCQGVMGSGVAKSVKEKFPKAFERYKGFVDLHKKNDMIDSLLGEVLYVRINDDKWVANMYGQFNYGYDGGKYTNTNALYSCFKDLRKNAEKHGLSVALPYMIGCYRGGADWKEVENLLLKAFDGYEVTLYKYHEG